MHRRKEEHIVRLLLKWRCHFHSFYSQDTMFLQLYFSKSHTVSGWFFYLFNIYSGICVWCTYSKFKIIFFKYAEKNMLPDFLSLPFKLVIINTLERHAALGFKLALDCSCPYLLSTADEKCLKIMTLKNSRRASVKTWYRTEMVTPPWDSDLFNLSCKNKNSKLDLDLCSDTQILHAICNSCNEDLKQTGKMDHSSSSGSLYLI